MKILYDSQIFWIQKFGGISRYFDWLCEHTGGLYAYEISGCYSENVYAGQLSNMKAFPIRANFKGKARVLRWLNTSADKKAVKQFGYDVYHPTYYYVPEYPKDMPVVITAHDFIHELFPEYFAKDKVTVPAKNTSLHNASRIIAISEHTKKDLLSFYPDIDEEKIDVVYHAIDWIAGQKHEMPCAVEKPYILFTGQRGAYKNFNTCIRAVASVLIQNDVLLVCTGPSFTEKEMYLIDSLHIKDRVQHIFTDDAGLKALYENALCFVFPSLYEGFGFPILEAFASGTPTVLANASCFPEIAGDASLYFDPNSESDIKGKISTIIQSESMRQHIIQKGYERYKCFSMEKMIEKTYNTYQKALNMYCRQGGVRTKSFFCYYVWNNTACVGRVA